MISEPGLLEELARRVEAAEAKFESANLDLRLTELEAAKKRQVTYIFFLFGYLNMYLFQYLIEKYSQMKSIKLQAEWVYHYESEVQNIHVELQSLKDIALSLPRKCWNTIRLEP